MVAITWILAQKVRILLRVSKASKGATILKVQLIFQNFCMHFNFEFWHKKIKIQVHINFQKLIDISIAYQLKIDRLRIL